MASFSLLIGVALVLLIVVSVLLTVSKQGGFGFFVLLAVLFIFLGGGAIAFFVMFRASSLGPIQGPSSIVEVEDGLPDPTPQQVEQFRMFPQTGVKGRLILPSVDCKPVGAMIESPAKKGDQTSWEFSVEDNGDFNVLGVCPGQKHIVVCVVDVNFNYYFYSIQAVAQLDKIADLGQLSPLAGDSFGILANFESEDGGILLPRTVYPTKDSVEAKLLLLYRAAQGQEAESFDLNLGVPVGEEAKLIGLAKGKLTIRPHTRFSGEMSQRFQPAAGKEVVADLPIIGGPLKVALPMLPKRNRTVRLDFPNERFAAMVYLVSEHSSTGRQYNPRKSTEPADVSMNLTWRDYQVFVRANHFNQPNPALNYYAFGLYKKDHGSSKPFHAELKRGTAIKGVLKDSRGQALAKQVLLFRYKAHNMSPRFEVDTDEEGRFYVQCLIPGEVLLCDGRSTEYKLGKAGEVLEIEVE